MKTTTWSEFFAYLIVMIVVVALCFLVTFLVVRHTQNKMNGGIVIDKYLTEKHLQTYSSYNSSEKRTELHTMFVPTTYTLVVQKDIKGKTKIKEVSVSAEKYYYTEIGDIYWK